jgi:molybdopterin synthase sulfur carrier subunit
VTATLRLPRFLSAAANTEHVQTVEGDSLEMALSYLFARQPGLRPHLLDENGKIRSHVSVFVDQRRADLSTPITDGAQIQVLQAVSGG